MTNSHNLVVASPRGVTLWTERGVLKHLKMIGTDQAWRGYDILLDTYFQAKENKTLKPNYGGFQIPETLSEALLLASNLEKERFKLAEKIKKDKPLVEFAETLQLSPDLISVRDFCTLLSQNDVKIGQKRFFRFLRKNGYLTTNNLPTQKANDLKIFEVKTTTFAIKEITHICHTSKITTKGQKYFLSKINSIIDWVIQSKTKKKKKNIEVIIL